MGKNRSKKASQHLFLGVCDESVKLDQSGEDPVLCLRGRPHLWVTQTITTLSE